MSSVVQEVEKLAAPALAEAGVEVVQVEFRREPQGWVLRFYLDKEGGFSLTDCETWSDRLAGIIEEGNVFSHPYSLEVSSPGLNRPLRKPEDFQRFMGLEAVVSLYAPQNNQKNFRGKMMSLEGDILVLLDRTSGPVKLPLSAIAGARLDPDIQL